MAFGVAVLGTGRIGGSYIGVVEKAPGAEIKVVAEPGEEAAATWRERHPGVDFVADYREVLERADVQVVIGALPHWLHYQAALDAAAAGKHIYMEKPLAVWAWQAEEMLAAARRSGVKLMTAHTQRYYPAVKAMKEIADRGELGSVIMAYDVWHKAYGPLWPAAVDAGPGKRRRHGPDGRHPPDRPPAVDHRLRRGHGLGTAGTVHPPQVRASRDRLRRHRHVLHPLEERGWWPQ